jgi:hypothetical protein
MIKSRELREIKYTLLVCECKGLFDKFSMRNDSLSCLLGRIVNDVLSALSFKVVEAWKSELMKDLLVLRVVVAFLVR